MRFLVLLWTKSQIVGKGEVDFFDRKTTFVSGPAKLAAKMNSPVLGVFCMREGPWQYRIVHKVLLAPDHDSADEVQLTQTMASEIERVIKLLSGTVGLEL